MHFPLNSIARVKIRYAAHKHKHKQNTQFSGNTKNVSKQPSNRVFATSIFAFLVDIAFVFWYKPLTCTL